MNSYTITELEEGIKALTSLVSKSEKALLSLKEKSSSHTTLTRRIKAFKMALEILTEKLNEISCG